MVLIATDVYLCLIPGIIALPALLIEKEGRLVCRPVQRPKSQKIQVQVPPLLLTRCVTLAKQQLELVSVKK